MFKFGFCDSPSSSTRPKCELENYPDPIQVPFNPRGASFDKEVEVVELAQGVALRKGRLSSGKVAEILNRPDLEGSDLIPGAYEGGFKLWEGAVDLCNFLINQTQFQQNSLKEMRVLELGCGHGLPGILCLLLGAIVHFQDFNSEVLRELTNFNVQLALNEDQQMSVVKFFGGEFLSIAKYCKENKIRYNWIIASEILYRPDSYPSIIETLATCLEEKGRAIIATKCCYFGVGGDLTSFSKHIQDDGRFESSIVWKNDNDRHSMRAILEIYFKS